MYKLAQRLNISPITLKKYLSDLAHLGLLKEEGKHRAVVALKDCIEVLIDHDHTKHLHFFKGKAKSTDYKYYTDLIKYSIPELNFRQQKYNIDLASISDRTLTIRQYKKLLKKYDVSCEVDLLKCMGKNKKDIVTGAFHISKMLRCSPASGGNLLRKWAKEGKFIRTVEVEFRRMECTHESFDVLKCEGFKYIHPNKSRTGFFLNLGSKIILPMEGEESLGSVKK